jgi:hypothetical protein
MNEDAIVEVLGDHQAAIDGLYARLEALDATGTHKKPPKWNWRSLGPSDLEAMWKRLWPWVEWLRTRYELSEAIPPCWYRHGAMVEELTALFAGWKAAYEDRRARAEAPLTWHEKLDHWRARQREWNRHGCSPVRHEDDKPAPFSEQEREVFNRWVDEQREEQRGRGGEPLPRGGPL